MSDHGDGREKPLHTVASSSPEPFDGLLEEAGIGAWQWDPASGRVDWDAQTEALYGLEQGTFGGTIDEYLALMHPEDVAGALELIQSVADRGGLYSIRHRVVWPDGTVRWIEGQGRIDTDDDGTPVRGYGVVYDVTDRSTLERERDDLRRREAEAIEASLASKDALDVLIRAGDALAGSLNTTRVTERLAHVLTEGFADFCIVDFRLEDPRGTVLTAGRNARTGATSLDQGNVLTMPHAEARLASVSRVDPASKSQLAAGDSARLAGLLPADTADLLLEPLSSRGRTIGSILVGRIDQEWSAGDKALLRAMARRAAVALDHAELYRDRSAIATMFQHAMSPGELPEVPHLDLGVLYRPATELVRLGGDYYDVFQLAEGSWALAVGDVCGKGVVAAGHAGLARSALRAAALATPSAEPALAVLNTTLLADPSEPLLTAALGVLRPMARSGWEITACSAGHPSPLIVRENGAVEQLNTSGTMLGYVADPTFQPAGALLEPGDSLVLFSDGVVEARRGKAFFGTERLISALSIAATAPAHAMADAVGATLDSWTAEPARNDVLLVVAKATDAS